MHGRSSDRVRSAATVDEKEWQHFYLFALAASAVWPRPTAAAPSPWREKVAIALRKEGHMRLRRQQHSGGRRLRVRSERRQASAQLFAI